MYEKLSLYPIHETSIDNWNKNKKKLHVSPHFLGLYQGAEYRILLKFDLSNLPLGAEIIKADLKMYCNRNDNRLQKKYYSVHLITQEWSSEAVTWTNQPSYDAMKKTQICITSNKSRFFTWEITSFVRMWQNSPSSNFGLIVIARNEELQDSLLGFEGLSKGEHWRPRLELVLRVPQSKIESLRPDIIPSPKIAILTPQFFEWGGDRCLFGGGERYLIDLANLLEKLGYEVDVYQPSIGEWEKTYEGVRIIGLGNTSFDIDFFSEANELFYDRTAEYDFHIYFNLTVHYPKAFRGSICINHGVWWDSNERPWWRTDRWYEKLFEGLKNIDTLVSVDTNTINWLNAVKPDLELKKVYIPNYVDLNCITNDNVSDQKEYLNVLYPRRLHPSRGWIVCKDVVVELISEYENLRFSFVGRGSEEDEEKLRKLSTLYPRIEHKWYDMRDIYQAYQEADIVLIPSFSSEGTSLSLIEAMAFGKPIIAGLVGGLTDLILPGYNGLLIEVTKENLKKAIVTLIENPEFRETLGRNAKEVAKYFSKSIWEERWRILLDENFSKREKTKRDF